MICGIYIRVSSSRQQDNYSVQSQRKIGVEFAKENGWDYNLYDEVGSGKSATNRPEFTRLINDIQDGKIQTVWAVEYSRISRSEEDSLFFRRLCIEHDIKVFTNDGPVPFDSPEDRLFHSIKSGIAQYEREKINQRIKRAFTEKKNSGNWKAVRCFGYDEDISIIPEQAEVICLVFDKYASGVGFPTLVRLLMKKGYNNWSGGKQWYVSNIRRILTKPAYAGMTLNDGGELIESNVYPPIIERDVWYRVQNIMKSRRGEDWRSGPKVSKSELSGVLVCSYCRKRYYNHNARKQHYIYPYYRHARPMPHQEKCQYDTRGYKLELLNHLVLASFLSNFESYESLEGFKNSLVQSPEQPDVRGLEERLHTLTEQKQRLIETVVEGVFTMDDIRAKSSAIQKEIDKIESQKQIALSGETKTGLGVLDELAEETIMEVFDMEPPDRKLMYKQLISRLEILESVLTVEWINGVKHEIDVDQPSEFWRGRLEEVAAYY